MDTTMTTSQQQQNDEMDNNDEMSTSSSESSNKNIVCAADLHPAIVHRILLMDNDPSEFSSLSMTDNNNKTSMTATGHVVQHKKTLQFEEFHEQLEEAMTKQNSGNNSTATRADNDSLMNTATNRENSFDDDSDGADNHIDDDDLQQQQQHKIQMVMTRAYRDHICEQVSTRSSRAVEKNRHPLGSLLCEVHGRIRSLIPNRKDLHTILSDEDVNATITASNKGENEREEQYYSTSSDEDEDLLLKLISLTIKAATSLLQLESEVRSETTKLWIVTATSIINKQQKEEISPSKVDIRFLVTFQVTSLLYLLYKIDLCQNDKENFYLQCIWAPQIHQNNKQIGYTLEKKAFEIRFGSSVSIEAAPITKKWIRSLIKQNDLERNDNRLLLLSKYERKKIIRDGWIKEILFHKIKSDDNDNNSDQNVQLLPEIFALDYDNIKAIRKATASAAAASALIVHACKSKFTKASSSSESSEDEMVYIRKKILIDLIKNMNIQTIAAISTETNTSYQDQFENDIIDATIRLAEQCYRNDGDESNSISSNGDANKGTREVERKGKTCNNLSLAQIDALSSRTKAVLSGQDPVQKLLDRRIQETFQRGVASLSSSPIMEQQKESFQNNNIPLKMKSGYQRSNGSQYHTSSSSDKQKQQIEHTIQLFCKQSIEYDVALDLAKTVRMADKIINLALDIYYDDLLDKMF